MLKGNVLSKKIVIHTLPVGHNIGGALQCIALSEVVSRFGCEVKLLNYTPFWVFFKRKLKTFLGISIKIEMDGLENINLTKKIYFESCVRRYLLKNSVSLLLVGSDQVFRYSYLNNAKLYYSQIDIAPVKYASYACSAGGATLGLPSSYDAAEIFGMFDEISIREASLKKDPWLKDKKTRVDLDPTLLLDADFYRHSFSLSENKNIVKKSVFSYILDPVTDLNIDSEFIVDSYNKSHGSLESVPKISIKNWLNRLSQAQYVITDSYHGMLFSIIFKKKFVVFPNHNRGLERFKEVIVKLGLPNDVISTNEKVVFQNIDWELVEKKLSMEKNKSIEYLKSIVSL